MRKSTAQKILDTRPTTRRWTKAAIGRIVKASFALQDYDVEVVEVKQLSTKWCDPLEYHGFTRKDEGGNTPHVPTNVKHDQQFKIFDVFVTLLDRNYTITISKSFTLERGGSFFLR